MKAYVAKGFAGIVKEINIPEIRASDVLVKVKAVAINPTDCKNLYGLGTANDSVVGCDLAGEVVEVGSDVKDVKIGDSIAAMVGGCSTFTPEKGAFAQYVAVEAKRAIKFPSPLSSTSDDIIPVGPITTFQGASSIGVAITTMGIAFGYHDKFIDLKPNSAAVGSYYLVWGGSTCIGQLTIQLAKYLGFKVVATASPKNFDLVKSLGCEIVFDYHDPDTPTKIKEYAGENITHALDAISGDTTIQSVYDSVSSTKHVIIQVSRGYLGVDESKLNRRKSNIVRFEGPLSYVAIDSKKQFGVGGPVFESPKGLLQDTVKIFARMNQIFRESPQMIKHMPIRVLPNGFEDIDKGMQIVKEGNVSAEKIVVTLE